MTTRPDAYIKSETLNELEAEATEKLDTEMSTDTTYLRDLAADLEAGSPIGEPPRRRCWHSGHFGACLFAILLGIAFEAGFQGFLFGLEALWLGPFIAISARFAIIYCSLRSALSASTCTEVWGALRTSHIRGKPITHEFSVAATMTICSSTGWMVISLAMTSK